MLLEKGHNTDLLPCAGITLIRFYGYDLRSVKEGLPDQTPRETLKLKAFNLKSWRKCKFFRLSVTFKFRLAYYFKPLDL